MVQFKVLGPNDQIPSGYRHATTQEVEYNKQDLFQAMPGCEIANLSNGSVDGCGNVSCDKRCDVCHNLFVWYCVSDCVSNGVCNDVVVSNCVSNDVSNCVSNDVSNCVSNDVSNCVSNDVSNCVSNCVSNYVVVSDCVSNDVSNCVSNCVSNDVDVSNLVFNILCALETKS